MTRLRGSPWVVLISLCLGFFMILLDTTIVNVAIPGMMRGLGASLDQVLWVVNAYTLVYAVLLITGGRLGDIVGRKRLFLGGMALFTLASVACGLSHDATQLIAARAVQGVGGALLTPQTLSTITVIFPAQRRGAAFGVWGSVVGAAPVAGPVVGGFLVTYVDWRWIFFVNVPICVIALVLAGIVMPDLRSDRKTRLDLFGVVLATAGLVAIVYSLIEGQHYNWGTITGPISIPAMIGAGVVLLVAFVAWQATHQSKDPLIPFAVLRNRNFTLANIVGGALQFGMLGLFLPLQIFLQSVIGLSAFDAGLTTAPMSVIGLLIAPLAGRLVDRIGGRFLLFGGLGLFSCGMALLDYLARADASRWTLLPGLLVCGLGMGFVFAPLQTVAMRTIKPQLVGAASGVITTTRQLGGVIGVAAVGALLQNRLTVTLHDQAVQRSGVLPAELRSHFVAGITAAAGSGLQGTAGSFPIPKGVPAYYVAILQRLGDEVFRHGYAQAQHPTLILPIAVMAVGAVVALALRRDTGAAPERTLQVERTQEPAPAVVSDVLVTIASNPTPEARGIARSVAERLGLPLLDLKGEGEVLADALHRALSSDPGARHEAVNLVAGLLATPPPSPEQVRELALELATRSGGVVLDTEYGRLQSGRLRSLRVTLEKGGRPFAAGDGRSGRHLAPHLSLDMAAIPPETAISIILAAAGTAGRASSTAAPTWTPADDHGYATATSGPLSPAE